MRRTAFARARATHHPGPQRLHLLRVKTAFSPGDALHDHASRGVEEDAHEGAAAREGEDQRLPERLRIDERSPQGVLHTSFAVRLQHDATQRECASFYLTCYANRHLAAPAQHCQ